jgi:hypothetical protein
VSELYIATCGDYIEAVGNDAPMDLKPLVAEAVGSPLRRIGRFIQLALIGAGRCAQHAKDLPQDAGVYLGSARGDLEVTIEVMQSLFRDGHAPKPLSFINTVSNAASFYIAQNLKLMGRSSFICNRYFAFESALQLAALDLALGGVTSALVGTVDVVVPPLEGHRIRLHLGLDTPVADASHWLCLQMQPSENVLGRLVAAEHFCDVAALRVWLSQAIDSNWQLAMGQFLPEDEAEGWCKELRLNVFDYRASRAYYDSQSGAAIGEFLRNTVSGTLLHLNRDPSGRYSAMVVAKN